MQIIDLNTDSEVIAIRPKVEQLTALAKVAIKTPAQYTQAGDWLKAIKGMRAKIEEARTRITRPINASLKEVNNQAKEQDQPLAQLEIEIKRSMGAFTAEQERLRLEEQRKADEIARKERERLAAEARAAEAAARTKAEEQRKAAEAAAAAGRKAEAAKLAARAVATEAKAEQRVATLEIQAAAVVAPVIQREAPKVAGIVTREVWKFEVTDPSLVPRAYLSVDESKIRGVVQSLKGDALIPGVRVYSDKSIASSAA